MPAAGILWLALRGCHVAHIPRPKGKLPPGGQYWCSSASGIRREEIRIQQLRWPIGGKRAANGRTLETASQQINKRGEKRSQTSKNKNAVIRTAAVVIWTVGRSPCVFNFYIHSSLELKTIQAQISQWVNTFCAWFNIRIISGIILWWYLYFGMVRVTIPAWSNIRR